MPLFSKRKPRDDGFEPLVLRRLADRSEGTRIKKFNPDTGEPYLWNPETERAEPWPFAGIEFEDSPPNRTRVSTSIVMQGISEGWIEGIGGELVHRPGGPPEDLWRVTHTFPQYQQLRFKAVSLEVLYDVVHNPDKYVADAGDEEKVTPDIYAAGDTDVHWYYDLKRNFNA